jgi:hypothetical protein
LDRLLDEDHSRLQTAWKARLERWEWEVIAEASYNHYGERGRVDLLAFHPASRTLAIVEIKSQVADAQGTLGPLDVKTRIAGSIARERGWPSPAAVVPVLIIKDTPTARRRLQRVAVLFGRLSLRGRTAISWLRRPDGHPSGLLILSDLSPAVTSRANQVGALRVRRKAVDPRSLRAAEPEQMVRGVG